MNRIKRGDTVEVITGEFRGERGAVRILLPKEGRVVVSGVNLVKRHQRPTGRVRTQAGIIEFEAPLRLSNVALVCPRCSQRTKVAFQIDGEGKKSRLCKRCGEPID